MLQIRIAGSALLLGLIFLGAARVTAEPKDGTAAKTSAQPIKAAPLSTPSIAAAGPEYVIGKEDVLNVDVWREPELTRTVVVRSDGKFSFPLIGEVPAVGLTPLQLKSALTEKLNGYLTSPIVSVSVQDARSQRISILGEVVRPGNYPLIKPMTVLDALAAAGGFRDFAKTSKMFILRIAQDGTRTRIPLKYKRVISEKQSNDNFELQARDTIIVP